MILEAVIGKLQDSRFTGKEVDYVDIDWFEVNKRIHRKTSQAGEDISISLSDHDAAHGLNQDDVLYCDDKRVTAVNIIPCEVLKIKAKDSHMVPKLCYEIGNRHAPFFYGDSHNEFIVPMDEPIKVMLEKMGFHAEVVLYKLNFNNKISASGHHHHH